MPQRQRLVFQPDAALRMQRGIHQMVAPIAATLGPLASHVVVASGFNGDKAEVLDCGGLIARRIIELSDPDEDMGAMFVRHLVTRLHRTVGDATATAAVLFRAVYDEGIKYLMAGGNPVLLRQHLETGAQMISDTLAAMVTHLEGKAQLAQLAESVCHDPPLAQMLGEIFDIIGENGQLEIRLNNQRGLHREYVEGAYWDSGVLSRTALESQPHKRIALRNPAILVTDLEIDDIRQLEAALAVAKQAGFRSLLILALKMSDAVLGLLSVNQQDDFQVVAAKTPGGNLSRIEVLQDVSARVGGRLFLKITGDTFDSLQPQDFGRARRAWVSSKFFGVIGGGSHPRLFRQHIATLRQSLLRADEPDIRKQLQERIGRLGGGSVTLRVGGLSKGEAQQRLSVAQRTADVIRSAVRGGVLPGGGMALIACRAVLRNNLSTANSADERAAYSILLKALEAPARTIINNAGYEASEILAALSYADSDCGYDVVQQRQVNMREAGIYDSYNATQAAVDGAIHSAAQALTVAVLVHRTNPERVMEPG